MVKTHECSKDRAKVEWEKRGESCQETAEINTFLFFSPSASCLLLTAVLFSGMFLSLPCLPPGKCERPQWAPSFSVLCDVSSHLASLWSVNGAPLSQRVKGKGCDVVINEAGEEGRAVGPSSNAGVMGPPHGGE